MLLPRDVPRTREVSFLVHLESGKQDQPPVNATCDGGLIAFKWRFIVVDVQTLIIGMDFLSYYGLLVDP
jgi:hypothetical protein